MNITELEKKSGLPRSTIHYYIRSGLLHEPVRKSQTVANYDDSHLQKLRRIQKIKDDFLLTANTTRVPLEFIRDHLDESSVTFANTSDPTPSDQQKGSSKKSTKKEQIIAAALRLYTERGYNRTNIRDITKKVGVSTPTFYHYFPDKRELFVEVIDHVIDTWKEKSAAATAGVTDDTKRSIILFRVFQENYAKIGGVINQLKAGAATGDNWARIRLAHVYKSLMEDLTKFVKSGIKNGTVRKVDPELMAYYLITIDEATVQRANLDDKYTIAELMRFIGNMVARGFLSDKGIKDFDNFIKKSDKRSK